MPILNHVSTIITNDQGEVLFVREAKRRHRNMWNLPGGHVELGEGLKAAAIREVREETGLEVELTGLLSAISAVGPKLHSIRHTFLGSRLREAKPAAGDQILEVRWMSPMEVVGYPDDELVGAPYLRSILQDHAAGKRYPIEIVQEM